MEASQITAKRNRVPKDPVIPLLDTAKENFIIMLKRQLHMFTIALFTTAETLN